MLSYLAKLVNKSINPPTRPDMPKMSTMVGFSNGADVESAWIPKPPGPSYDRQSSIRRQLSRKLSSRAKQLSPCNTTACAIGSCFIIAIFALIISTFNFYMYAQIHGFGPIPASENGEVSTSQSQESGQQTSGHQPNFPLPPQGLDGGAESADATSQGAYAHIVGINDGAQTNDHDFKYLISWQENVTENVEFTRSSGKLRIKEAGVYYVYSQLYFSDTVQPTALPSNSKGDPMRFMTRRNGQTILETVQPFKEYTTKFHGGVFRLEKDDVITVRVSSDIIRINTERERTYFGVFMLGPGSAPQLNPEGR